MNGNKGEIRIEEPTRAGGTIARRAAESRATVPHLELSDDVVIAEDFPQAKILPLVVGASARALRDVPRANASYRDGRFELYSRVNIGVTMATEDAYTIPTVFDADSKPLGQLEAEIDELRRRAAGGQLSPPEVSGATFTVSEASSERAAPVIVPPQAAALSAGRLRHAPIVRAGAIVVGRVMTITIACDHRILYGSNAAQFLAAIASGIKQSS